MSTSQDLVQSFFRRWSSIEREKADLAEESRELFAEAKADGFDTKALRAAFRAVQKHSDNPAEADEFDGLVDLYVASIQSGSLTHVHPRVAHEEPKASAPPYSFPASPDPGQGNNASDARPEGDSGVIETGQSEECSRVTSEPAIRPEMVARGGVSSAGGEATTAPPVADDDLDIPDFLRRDDDNRAPWMSGGHATEPSRSIA